MLDKKDPSVDSSKLEAIEKVKGNFCEKLKGDLRIWVGTMPDYGDLVNEVSNERAVLSSAKELIDQANSLGWSVDQLTDEILKIEITADYTDQAILEAIGKGDFVYGTLEEEGKAPLSKLLHADKIKKYLQEAGFKGAEGQGTEQIVETAAEVTGIIDKATK